MSPKHLNLFVRRFAINYFRDTRALDQTRAIVGGMDEKQLRYRDLITDKVLVSGTRA